MRSVDLVDFQEGRSEILDSQVGKGDEVRLPESLRSSEVSSNQQGVLTEEDQTSILIIGGIDIFLPNNQVEARAHVESATKRQPVVTVIKEEKEQILISSPAEE
jgi:hypothetical protein